MMFSYVMNTFFSLVKGFIPFSGLLKLSLKDFPVSFLKSSIFPSNLSELNILFSSLDTYKTHKIPAHKC